MKKGKDFQELFSLLTSQLDSKMDVLVPANEISFRTNTPLPYVVDVAGDKKLKPTPYALGQFATYTGIPRQYVRKMEESQAWELLADNFNNWLSQQPERRMVRAFSHDDQDYGILRAFLSSKYRRLDNYDLLGHLSPIFNEYELEVKSCDLTETKLYLKAVFPQLEAEVKPGDPVQAGIVISNSEVGAGSVQVQPLVYRLVCSNGMIAQKSLRKYHVGRRQAGDNYEHLLSDRTKETADRAFWMSVQDVVRGSLQQDIFNDVVNKLKEATTETIESKPKEVVERLSQKYTIDQKSEEFILESFLRGNDSTKYGLVNAVTRASQDVEDYEKATELESIGGKVLELSGREWTSLACK